VEPRLSRLEGTYEQVDRRLTSLDMRFAEIDLRFGEVRTEIAGLRSDMNTRFAELDWRFSSYFKWTIGMIFGSWLTTMLAILLHR
jgi:hypothetical protein